MKNSLYLFILLLSIIVFSSCDTDGLPDTQAQLVAPAIPPAEMYVMPTEALRHTGADTTDAHRHGISYRNWVHAGLNLLVWNTAVVLNGTVPFAAFGRALNERPVHIGNGVFEWSYTYQAPDHAGGHEYDVVLTAEYINNREDVQWIMKLSQVDGFSDFEWYTGVVSRDHTEAIFTLNHRPNNPEPFISIAYSRNPVGDDASIRYTNIRPSDAGRGGYIEYRVASETQFNRGFEVNPGPIDPTNLLQIEWNAPTNEGRVKHEKYFNDEEWHCWNTNLQDTDC